MTLSFRVKDLNISIQVEVKPTLDNVIISVMSRSTTSVINVIYCTHILKRLIETMFLYELNVINFFRSKSN